jgi:hypothetical protein
MVVLHNLQVNPRLDPDDDKDGLVVMTNWGDFDGGNLVLDIMGKAYHSHYGVHVQRQPTFLERRHFHKNA